MISKFRESLRIVIVGIVMIALFSSGLVLYIKKVNNTEVKVEQPISQTETTTTEESKPTRIWRGSDYGLPAGVIVGGEQDNENPALNWLTIQQPDGHMTIVHNIDGRLWNAVQNGDIIE
jgi:hypothetical protein